MKLKTVNKLLAISVSISMMMPSAVMAAETENPDTVYLSQTEEDTVKSEENAAESSLEISEIPGENEEVPGESEDIPNSEPPEVPGDSEEIPRPEPPEVPGDSEEIPRPEPPEVPGESGEIPRPELPKFPGEGTGETLPELPENPEEDGEVQEEEEQEKESEYASNEELIAQQQIIQIPQMVEDFRFWTVAKKYSFAKADMFIREDMTEEARNVGILPKDGVCYILKEEENGWFFVESGAVRGFVKTEEVLYGDEADEIVEARIKEAKEKAEKRKEAYRGVETVLITAGKLIPDSENAAFLHTRSTVRNVVVEKLYALCTADAVNIREGKGTDTRIVGTMSRDTLCYVLADKETDWIYIESGDVRGFVKSDYLQLDEQAAQQVSQAGEEAFPSASEKISIEENQACYYTITSIKSGVPKGELRQSVLEFASQFIGNPYVWGGTSLTEGADCSGFVQSIFAQYGYSLPRTAEDQAQYGIKIPVEDAQPGDLIFYAEDGYIYHVVIYAGEGQTVEAMGTAYGIVRGNLNTQNAVWAARVLEDTVYTAGGGIGEVNVTPEQYGECLGTFRITHYCGGSCCNDEWAGLTSTGVQPIEGDTIAVDPAVIPYGTKVIINGHIFTASDCGGAIKENRIDVFVNNHERANELGVYYSDVYLLK